VKHIHHTKHYWRAAFLIVIGLVGFLALRAFLIPDSFGEYGFYRADNVQEQRDKPISFAKRGTCANCHEGTATHEQGKHKTVQCQNCHAPLAVHVKDDEFIDEMPINRAPSLCLRCHRALPSRPHDFPQIVVKDHVGTIEHNLTSGACLECHKPHDPTLDRGGH
jgi:hypothetical protein